MRFTGAVPYVLAPRYLALADVAVAPKLAATEGSGKLLPYMSMALPVISTDTPAHRQYLGREGVWVTPATPAALAAAIAETLADLPARREDARRLRNRVIERYAWAQTAGIMAAEFQALVAEGKST